MQGVFIARLNTWNEQDGECNVKEVKDALKADVSIDKFHPEWLKRTSVVHRKVFELDPVHDQTVRDPDEISDRATHQAKSRLRRLQTSMRRKIEETNFSALTDDSSELGIALTCGGVSDCLDVLVDTLEGKSNDIVYITNVNMDNFLKTTRTVSMSCMKTNLESLSDKDISGITKPTVYIGTQYSTFCCHREDMAFCSINRHISGSPKIWHCVPPRFYSAFVRFLLMLPFPEENRSKLCFLQHKSAWVDPRMVMKAGIPVYTVVQRPGDIVVLLPYTVHLGFNINLNINEACNFVSQRWILPGLIAQQRCTCNEKWNSRFDLRQVLKDLHADPSHIRDWEVGMVLSLNVQLKKEQPLLYPHLRDMGDEPVDRAFLLGYKTEEEPHQFQEVKCEDLAREKEEESSGKAKCTRCDYCPNRNPSPKIP